MYKILYFSEDQYWNEVTDIVYKELVMQNLILVRNNLIFHH